MNVYYTANDQTYTVNYLEKGTGKSLAKAQTKPAKYSSQIAGANEYIKITGYAYDSVDPETLTIGTNNSANVINVFYTATEQVYTVKYLEKGTGKELSEAIDKPTKFGEEIQGADEKIAISGYTYDSVSPEKLVISTDDSKNVINVYYTANAQTYTVNYLEKGTGKVLSKAQVKATKYAQVIESEQEKIAIEGYSYDSVTPEKLTIGSDNRANVIHVYYTANAQTYTVNYLEKGTNKPLSKAQTKNAKYADTITGVSEQIAITGYSYDSVSPESLTIGTDNAANVINVYYTANKQTYMVNYLEKGTR